MFRSWLACVLASTAVAHAEGPRVEWGGDFAPAEGWVKPAEKPFRAELCLNGSWQFQPVLAPANFKRGTGEASPLPPPSSDGWDSAEVARQLFPERPLAEVQDDGVTYRGHWTRWTGKGPVKERLFYATSPKSLASFEFQGERVTCIHKVGPDCGVAEVLIDGAPAQVPEIDTYASQVEWNQRTELAAGLAPR